MNKILASLGIGGTLVLGGVDASKLDEKPTERIEQVAEYTIEAKQVGNVVETTFPWKDQPGIKVKVDLGEPTLEERVKDKRKKEVVTEVVDFGDGGFKIDILLDEKPDTNRFCYQIDGAENYDFFFQPPLTDEEIAEGAYRPENIVGSYAVYHKALKNHRIGGENYATGKAMHILRPQVWELGNKESTKQWADLSYKEEEGLCVTASQDFLDKATYPVRIDPTIGYTSIGASALNNCNEGIGAYDGYRYIEASLGSSGTIDSMSAALYAADAAALNSDFKFIVYDKDSSGAGSHGLLYYKESTTIADLTGVSTFFTFTFAGESLVADTFILASTCDNLNPQDDKLISYDTATVYSGFLNAGAGNYITATAPDNPLVSGDTEDNNYSVYLTYTASGGGGSAATATPRTFINGNAHINGSMYIAH